MNAFVRGRQTPGRQTISNLVLGLRTMSKERLLCLLPVRRARDKCTLLLFDYLELFIKMRKQRQLYLLPVRTGHKQ